MLSPSTVVFLFLFPLSANPENIDALLNKETTMDVVVPLGGVASLSCHIGYHQNSTVSWLRPNSLQILTVGKTVFSIDKRFMIKEHSDDKVWILRIEKVNYDDAGDYECQVTSRNQSSSQIANLNVVNISEVHVKVEPVKHLDNASAIIGKIASEGVEKDTDKASTYL